MPGSYSYPGVYVEEIPSGVRTIVGVSTSNTAFIGVFSKGPVNEPTRITNFGDFERTFGGLDTRSEASFAIMQYFLNGGAVAWVVRVVGSTAVAATQTFDDGDLTTPTTVFTVSAKNKGAWGNNVQVEVEAVSVTPDELFNLIVSEVKDSAVNPPEVLTEERFLNLTLNPASSRFAQAVVNSASVLVDLADAGAWSDPIWPVAVAKYLGTTPGTAGADGNMPCGPNAYIGVEADKTGIYALDKMAPAVFNLLSIPAAANLSTPGPVYNEAVAYCEAHRAFCIIDIGSSVVEPDDVESWLSGNNISRSDHAALYFPRLEMPDPLDEYRYRNVASSGTLTGIYARTDSSRGIWKAPAGTDADLRGAQPVVALTDPENGALNPLGFNVVRNFPVYGNLSWGARTLDGADQLASEWKYIPVRRLALYIEESLFQGLKWVVFEPNDEPLWGQIRLNVGSFMHNLFRQGAFQGDSPKKAYFVKCDGETTTQTDINLGIVNIVVGFAPLKPAEFVVIKIQQIAGQIAV